MPFEGQGGPMPILPKSLLGALGALALGLELAPGLPTIHASRVNALSGGVGPCNVMQCPITRWTLCNSMHYAAVVL